MIVLCSFANKLFMHGFPRLHSQAIEMNVFDEIYLNTEKDLNADFKRKFRKELVPYSKGYGYWCWKPQIILQTLNKMNEGDILLYMDLGSHLNVDGRKKLEEYIELVRATESGIFAFRSPVHIEKKLTKMDLLDYFGVAENTEFTDTTQIEATHIFIRKCNVSVSFVKEWLQVIYKNFDLITDSPSTKSNSNIFYAHRHDQSIFSVLGKKYNVKTLSTDETYSTDWTTMGDYPLLAKRDRVLKYWWQKKYYSKIGKIYKLIWKLRYSLF